MIEEYVEDVYKRQDFALHLRFPSAAMSRQPENDGNLLSQLLNEIRAAACLGLRCSIEFPLLFSSVLSPSSLISVRLGFQKPDGSAYGA